jgi:hypothetical protein
VHRSAGSHAQIHVYTKKCRHMSTSGGDNNSRCKRDTITHTNADVHKGGEGGKRPQEVLKRTITRMTGSPTSYSSASRCKRSGARSCRMCWAAPKVVQDLKESSTVIDLGGPLGTTGDGSCRRRRKADRGQNPAHQGMSKGKPGYQERELQEHYADHLTEPLHYFLGRPTLCDSRS